MGSGRSDFLAVPQQRLYPCCEVPYNRLLASQARAVHPRARRRAPRAARLSPDGRRAVHGPIMSDRGRAVEASMSGPGCPRSQPSVGVANPAGYRPRESRRPGRRRCLPLRDGCEGRRSARTRPPGGKGYEQSRPTAGSPRPGKPRASSRAQMVIALNPPPSSHYVAVMQAPLALDQASSGPEARSHGRQRRRTPGASGSVRDLEATPAPVGLWFSGRLSRRVARAPKSALSGAGVRLRVLDNPTAGACGQVCLAGDVGSGRLR